MCIHEIIGKNVDNYPGDIDRGSDVTRVRRVHQSGGSLKRFYFTPFSSFFFFFDFFHPLYSTSGPAVPPPVPDGRARPNSREIRDRFSPRSAFPDVRNHRNCLAIVLLFFFVCLVFFLPYFLFPLPRIRTTSVTLRSRSAQPVLCLFLARSWHTTPPQKCSQKNALFSPPFFGNPSSPSQARDRLARRFFPAALFVLLLFLFFFFCIIIVPRTFSILGFRRFLRRRDSVYFLSFIFVFPILLMILLTRRQHDRLLPDVFSAYNGSGDAVTGATDVPRNEIENVPGSCHLRGQLFFYFDDRNVLSAKERKPHRIRSRLTTIRCGDDKNTVVRGWRHTVCIRNPGRAGIETRIRRLKIFCHKNNIKKKLKPVSNQPH